MFKKDKHLIDAGGFAFQTIAPLISTGLLISAYRKTKKKWKRFWLFLGMGSFSYFIGMMLWSYYELFLKVGAETTILPEMFWIGQNLFYLFALLIVMYEAKNRLITFRLFLDILIVMSVAATFYWKFIIDPLLDRNSGLYQLVGELIYPILDLGVLFGVISFLIASNRMFTKKSSLLIVSGLLIQIIADTIFSYLKVKDTYEVGSINEPLWIFSLLLIGLAGNYHEKTIHKSLPSNFNRIIKGKILKHTLPYTSVIFLFTYVVFKFYEIDTIVFGLFISILLVILRQIITLLENDRLVDSLHGLNEELESKVKNRTEQLEETLTTMEYLAYHDVVTTLPNRRLLEIKLSEALERASNKKSQIAVMLLDLDRFKQINDSLGHSYGDLLLIEIGQRLKSILDEGVIICRIGGDEFSILVEFTEISTVEENAKRIIFELGKPFFIKEAELHITTSIGIAIFPEHGSDFSELLMQADMAMYRVKEQGKNNYEFYHSSMNMQSRVEMENALRKAIQNEEFILYYQPQLSLSTGEIIGAEALIRWNRPDHGMVTPEKFIPIAEESGIITTIGEWVIRKACEQIVLLKRAGFKPLRIAANISSIQFQQIDFVEVVCRIIKETGADPELLELEITESIAVKDIEDTIAKLSALKKTGIQISIDDFGMGYSSLHYLSQFQIDRLKIDRNFILNIDESEKDVAIVKLITMMAKGLNLKVLAEGVEMKSHLNFLKEIECDEFQGFLFSPPVPIEDFMELLSHEKSNVFLLI
ncbi:EAL domain-containing protein [Bacillus sp. UNCCL13]|uniref:EAL domain-containing protein n=1 Tax=Bacillus sp. UNCCL13 TaxID=1502772 RepID=UPI001C31A905|nr:EAL domain-containing protein [Bacillus sp. UNCCL13]